MNCRLLSSRALISFLIIALSACTTHGPKDSAPQHVPVDIHKVSNAVPKYEPKSKWGNPSSYSVLGKTYYTLESSKDYVQRGHASWYGTKFHGKRTSSGEPYDMYAMTAAHKTLPLPSYVEVENLDNGKKIVVKVNDRGPFHAGRIIDLSYVAAMKLGIAQQGTGRVEVRALDVSGDILASSEKNIFVQVGAFSDKENAERMHRRLAGLSISSDIHEYIISATRQIYRVRIGPFESRNKAETIIEDLEEIGVENAKVLSD